MTDELTWDPGWFPDPVGRHDHRWWDGAAWTAHVADAGVAAQDPLDARPEARTGTGGTPAGTRPMTGRSMAGSGGEGRGSVDPVAVVALVLALIAVLVALLPGLGLVPAVVALIVAVIARSRIRRSGRGGGGMATSGLVISIGALLLAALVTAIAVSVFAGSGGELQEAFRAYADCLEVSSQAECRRLLEQDLSRMVR
jgi:lysylphosphatidylglycerol synthetase-like protein (DUF2156 family)